MVGAGDGEAKKEARCEAELSYHHCLLSAGADPTMDAAEALRVGCELDLFPVSVCAISTQHQDSHARGEEHRS